MRIKNSSAGFTLIETVVYIALLAILIGGGMVGIFNILEGGSRTRQTMYREQEAYFITRKIDAVISEVESAGVSIPPPDGDVLQTSQARITIDSGAKQITLERGGNIYPLNDILIPATSLNFERNVASSTLVTTFTLDGNEYRISNFVRW